MKTKIKIKNVVGVLVITAILLVMSVVSASASSNDNFINAKVIPDTPYSDIVDTTDATTESGEPLACGWNLQNSIWYSFTPAQNGYYTIGSSGGYYPVLAIYTGPDLNNLQVIDCKYGLDSAQSTLLLEAGTSYYFQTFFTYPYWGLTINFDIYQNMSPANDDFINARVIGETPYIDYLDSTYATTEPGEPASCGENLQRSVWYTFTPAASDLYISESNGGYYPVLAIYTGSDLYNLHMIDCRTDWNSAKSLLELEAGTTYYFQTFNNYADWGMNINFNLYLTPPPEAYFSYWPGDANKYDSIQFSNDSYDPAGVGFETCAWDFGDGSSATDCYPTHTFVVDGDYTVQLTVTTFDGRTALTTQTVQVRTHDIGITRFVVPNSARVGQTKQINVYIKNLYYQETVQVDLYKVTANGDVWVGSLVQSMPVRPANRAQLFTFAYTFSSEDAAAGKVTFKVIASVQTARDAFPLDNELVSFATKVTQ
jgi:PKD repeat protein